MNHAINLNPDAVAHEAWKITYPREAQGTRRREPFKLELMRFIPHSGKAA